MTRYDFESPDYRALAEFRFQLRTFLKQSELAAQAVGLEPQQYQLLLAIKARSVDDPPTVGRLAERMLLKHHSTVELIDRCERLGLTAREHDADDHRRVLIRLTAAGEDVLRRLARVHEDELTSMAPHLIQALEAIVGARA